jgi:hypothetical protein
MDVATINNVGWVPFLDEQMYVKFGILHRDATEPKIYFINSNTYTINQTSVNISWITNSLTQIINYQNCN